MRNFVLFIIVLSFLSCKKEKEECYCIKTKELYDNWYINETENGQVIQFYENPQWVLIEEETMPCFGTEEGKYKTTRLTPYNTPDNGPVQFVETTMRFKVVCDER